MCQNNIRRYSPMNDQYLILPLKLMISFAAICRLKKKKKKEKEKERKRKTHVIGKEGRARNKVGQKKAEQKFAVA